MPDIYRIYHNYDRGDQSIYVASATDLTRAAVYCQFQAEEESESASVTNEGIALALVRFYGCTLAEKTDTAIELDMFFAREQLCVDYDAVMADQTLHRAGLLDMLRPHIHA